MLKKLLSILGVYKLYEKWLWIQVKNGENLEHIAIILDGNRRWASEQELNPWLGHKKGAETVEQLLDWCQKLNVKFVTLYTFSTENFRRSPEEIEEIMRIAEEKFRKLLTDERIHRNKVHVKVIGRVNLLPLSLQQLIADVEKATEKYDTQFLISASRFCAADLLGWCSCHTSWQGRMARVNALPSPRLCTTMRFGKLFVTPA